MFLGRRSSTFPASCARVRTRSWFEWAPIRACCLPPSRPAPISRRTAGRPAFMTASRSRSVTTRRSRASRWRRAAICGPSPCRRNCVTTAPNRWPSRSRRRYTPGNRLPRGKRSGLAAQTRGGRNPHRHAIHRHARREIVDAGRAESLRARNRHGRRLHRHALRHARVPLRDRHADAPISTDALTSCAAPTSRCIASSKIPKSGMLPWDEKWVRKLLVEIPKQMHWNSFRFCIGPVPDQWLEIADEAGLLIQNEYFVWTGNGWHGARRPGALRCRGDDRRVRRMDARQLESSERGHLGCQQRDLRSHIRREDHPGRARRSTFPTGLGKTATIRPPVRTIPWRIIPMNSRPCL